MQCILFMSLALVLTSCSVHGEKTSDTSLNGSLRTCGPDGPVRYLVIRTIGLGRADAGVSVGFDLDTAVTALGGPTGCGVEDYVSPDGTPGIDNALAGLMPFLEATEGAALEPLIQQKINEGELTLLVEVSGVDDLEQDDCVQVRMLRGAGMPELGTDNLLLADQTFELDPSVTVPAPAEGAILNGVLDVRGVSFDLPVVIFEFDSVLELTDAALRVDMDPAGPMLGVLGSGFRWQPVLEELLTTPIDASLQEALPLLLGQLADLRPDEAGLCQELSVVMEVSTAGAFVFDD